MTDGLKDKDRSGIRAVLAASPKVRRAVLFGSRALETFRGASDVDLALEGTDIRLQDLLAIQAQIAKLNLPVEVDLVVRATISNPELEKHIKAYGREWYRKGWGMACDTITECTVGDVAAPSRNALVGGPFGSDLVSRDYVPSGVPVIRGTNMGHGRWVAGEFAYVTREKADSLASNCARGGDLVFTQRGTLGQVALVPKNGADRYLISQSQMKVTLDPSKADALFLYYVFISPEQQAYIIQNAIATGVPHTNLGILRNTPLTLPPLAAQKAIAAGKVFDMEFPLRGADGQFRRFLTRALP